MSKDSAVPDAWDDSWEAEADRPEIPQGPPEPARTTKAERLAKHAELNKKLWESADSDETFHFVETRNEVPLKSDFKPAVKVLSRKPAPKLASRHDNTSGISRLAIDDDEDDEVEDASKQITLSAEERKQKAQKEREDKQRRYDEARERLFGASGTASGESSPGTLTPPTTESKTAKGKGKGRGSRDARPNSSSGRETPRSVASRSNADMNDGRQLYDPDYTAKSTSSYVQRKNQDPSRRLLPTADEELQPIRAPRGPDGSGRGGFGFTGRGKGSP
ncbi:MAG: hypothetical protein M4579_002584 [Chaenotheca gracillima]|nr:MAG: hypothetical protein M4579_002584 [Chaenotheca gracillima]